jgi:hypothetical protein
MKDEPVKALVAFGVNGTGVVVSTDSPGLTYDLDEINDLTGDLGFPDGPAEGLFLFEGVRKVIVDVFGDHDCEYVGAYRTVLPDEWKGLLEMVPPQQDLDDWDRS